MTYLRWFRFVLFALPMTLGAQMLPVSPPRLAPAIGPEVPVSDFVYRPAVRDQDGGVIASDGQNFLVAWFNGPTFGPGIGPGSLYASRIDETGKNLDGFGIRISSSARAGYGLSGAWGNSRYLIVWVENVSMEGHVQLAATTVDRDGKPGSRILLGGAISGEIGAPSVTVAFDGTNFLVVWGVAINFGDLEQRAKGALISAEGDLLRGPFDLTPPGKAVIAARVSANRSGFRLFYSTRTELWTAPVDSSGTTGPLQLIQSRTDVPLLGPYEWFTVASDGSGWAIAHQVTSDKIDIVFLENEGSPSESLVARPWNALQKPGHNPRIFWAGGPAYLLAVPNQSFVSLRAVAPGGTLGETGALSIRDSNLSGIAWSGSKVLITVYEGIRFSDPQGRDLFAAILNVDPSPGSFVPAFQAPPYTTVVMSASEQRASAAATDGRNLLHIWEEYLREEKGWHLFAGRLDANGKALDGTGIRLSTKSDYFHPSVSFDGSNFLAVWSEGLTLVGNRISPDGKPLDGKGFVISRSSCSQTSSDIAWNGTSQMVVWTECREAAGSEGAPTGHIYGSRISPSGQVIDTAPLQISFGPRGEQQPAITAIGSNFFVAWEENGMPNCGPDFCGQPPSRLYGRRISESATHLDVAQTSIAIGRAEFHNERFPSLASNGSTILVAWASLPEKGTRYARLDGDGRLLDIAAEDNGTLIGGGERSTGPPAVAWDGVNFVVVHSGRGIAVMANRISVQGELLDRTPLLLSPAAAATAWETFPTAEALGRGEVAIGYIRHTDDDVYGRQVNRLFSRRVREPLLRRRAARLN